MKIIVKIDAGAPVLFFPDEPASKPNLVKTATGETPRAYMRSLPTAQGVAQRNAAWMALASYCRQHGVKQ